MNTDIHSSTKSQFWANNFKDANIFAAIGALLLLTLQFQTIPLQIRVQTLPVTTILALIFFPFCLHKIPRSPLLIILSLFFGFSFLHSSVALLVDLLSGSPDVRFFAWGRQFFALFAGAVTYLVFRTTFLYIKNEKIVWYIAIGSLPALLLGLLNVFWGGLGQSWAGSIVEGIRAVMSPDGYTSPLRTSGFASEPSHFASMLIILMLPVIFILMSAKKNRVLVFCLLILSVLAFTWTFSTVGLVLLLVVLISGVFLGPKRKLLIGIILFFLIAVSAMLYIFPNNQVLRHARILATGQVNVSFTDRFYSAFGPFILAPSSLTIVGYGLGGISTHFKEVVPHEVQAEILAAKWKELPSLASFFGRTFAETGAIGLALFLCAMGLTFHTLRLIERENKGPAPRVVYSSIRLGLVAAMASLFISVGPYHTPFFWLWIAFIDSRYILINKKDGK